MEKTKAPKRKTKTARKIAVKVKKEDSSLPIYGFQKLFFIDSRAGRIVQGQVETINTIRKPLRNEEKDIIGVKESHYYTLRTEISPETVSIHEDSLYDTNLKAARVLGSIKTDYLR